MLVLPSVSIGNVPQLALDLVIHTYGFELIKSLDDELLCPFAGPLDYVEGEQPPQDIATAVQLFKYNDDYIVQLRSPPLPGRKQRFVDSLIEQIPELLSKGVIILSSANAGARIDEPGVTADFKEITQPEPLQDAGFVNEALASIPGSRAIVSYVYEGDNFADALRMAQKLVVDLHLPLRAFKQPVSWSRFYGKEPPLGLEEGIYT